MSGRAQPASTGGVQRGTAMSTREVLRVGGVPLLGTLSLLNFFDDFGLDALRVLGPDVQNSLGLSDTAITVLGALGGALVLLGSVPAAALADRYNRLRIISITSLLLGVFTLLTGMAQAAWQLVVVRIGAGINKGNLPAFNSVVADAVPLEGRTRAYSLLHGSGALALLLTPVTVGGIADLAGGDEGWRWAFVATGIPVIVLGALAWRLRDPRRGQFERAALLGEDAAAVDDDGPPPRMDEAFARLKRIKTFYFVIVGLAAVGIGLFVVPSLTYLYLEEEFGLDASERGVVGSFAAAGPMIGILIAGAVGDRFLTRNPAGVLRGCGVVLLGMLATAIAMHMPNVPLFVVFAIIGGAPPYAVFVVMAAVTAPIVPPRLRSMGFALTVLYMAVVGGFGGAILGGALSDSFGERTAVTVLLVGAVPVAAVLMQYAARFVEQDMQAVGQDLLEEEAQRQLRRERPDGPLPGEPLLDVRRLDFAYAGLQVLFGVDLEVRQGEVLAVLGTNGAGKSTLLRAITGLGFPDSGVVRFAGQDVTYKEPAGRVRLGIIQVPGGKAIFPSLTVEENLRLGGFVLPESTYRARRADVLDIFPILQGRLEQPAGTMSGGERQMLALAKGMLLDPRLLCIDELSLGLAPIVVEQLIGVVAELKARGVTMLIVEQSVNVALTLADRAIFMEKGHVRFEGSGRELLERDDLVRAVFLGGEGG